MSELLEHELSAHLVLRNSRADDDQQQETHHIYSRMAFAAIDLLGCVVVMFMTSDISRL